MSLQRKETTTLKNIDTDTIMKQSYESSLIKLNLMFNILWQHLSLTLVNVGWLGLGWGGRNHPPLFAISPQLNLRGSRDYTLEFVLYGPLYTNRGLYLSHFNSGGPTKFEKTFTQISILRYLRPFLPIFHKILDLKKKLRGRVFKLGVSSSPLHTFI